jgi:hypothetical protein
VKLAIAGIEVQSPYSSIAIAVGVGLGTMLALLGLLATLVSLTLCKTRAARAHIKFLVKSFVFFEMKAGFALAKESIDIVLDTLNFLVVQKDGSAEYLRVAYIVIFGCSAVASLCKAVALLSLLFSRLRMRFATYALERFCVSSVLYWLELTVWCRLQDAGKVRSKTPSEQKLMERIEGNRLSQVSAVVGLLCLVFEGSFLRRRSFRLRPRSSLPTPHTRSRRCGLIGSAWLGLQAFQ